MSLSVAAADTLAGTEDAPTFVNSTIENSHSSWKAPLKRRSGVPHAALAALIPLLLILALTVICVPLSRRSVSRRSAIVGRRLAAGEEEESDDEVQSRVIEECLDLQAEIGYSPPQVLIPSPEAAARELEASVLQFQQPQGPAHAAESEFQKGGMLELLFSPKVPPQIGQPQSPPPSPASGLHTPVVAPSTPSYSGGSSSAFSFEDDTLAFLEHVSSWEQQHETAEKRAFEDVESAGAVVPPKRQKAETVESSHLQQAFPSWAHVQGETSTTGFFPISQEAPFTQTSIPSTSEDLVQEAYATFSMSEGSVVPMRDQHWMVSSPSTSTLSSTAPQVAPEVPFTSFDAPSTSSFVEGSVPSLSSSAQSSLQFPLPPPAPLMPRNTHLYFRLPMFVPMREPRYMFNAGRALGHHRIGKLLTDELRAIRFFLAQRTLDSSQGQILVESCERLVNITIREHTTNIEGREPRQAAETLGRRYLALEAAFCTIQVLGPLMHAEAWWPQLTQQIPTSYTRELFVASRRTRDFHLLAVRLSEALESLKRGVRPGEEETIKLKRDLFTSAPRRFQDSVWDPWREDPDRGDPLADP
ncbi:hypothetical protein Emed_003319 [Eimeria media]